jgi:hypothetical protein
LYKFYPYPLKEREFYAIIKEEWRVDPRDCASRMDGGARLSLIAAAVASAFVFKKKQICIER